jgi:hypothetical protein
MIGLWELIPVAEEPEIFGFLCRHCCTMFVIKKVSRINVMQPMSSVRTCSIRWRKRWRISIAGPMDPLGIASLNRLHSSLRTQHPYSRTSPLLSELRWCKLEELLEDYLRPPGVLLLPLQHPPLSPFASNRDQDVTLAAVDVAYQTRAIDRSCEVFGSNLKLASLLLGEEQVQFYGDWTHHNNSRSSISSTAR